MKFRAVVNENWGRKVVRISRGDLESMELRSGDVVEVSGSQRSFGRIMPSFCSDGDIVLDNCLAKNVGVESNEPVGLSNCDLGALRSVTFQLNKNLLPDEGTVRRRLIDIPLCVGDSLPLTSVVTARVLQTTPENGGLLTDSTELRFNSPDQRINGYEGVGGLEAQIQLVHEIITGPLFRPELFTHLGLSAPSGVLFLGPPGVGKTLLARAVAQKSEAAFFSVNGPDFLTKHFGESEAALRNLFASAAKNSPSIIFIDEIDSIAPSRARLSDEKQVEKRIVAQLLTLMDGLDQRKKIIVLAATNVPEALDPALRRAGRFDREIVFKPPNESERLEILCMHLQNTPLEDDVDLDRIAADTHGYVGADLAALTQEAAMVALKRCVEAAGGEEKVQTSDLSVRQSDLLHGLQETKPSLLRADQFEMSPIKLRDIGGLNEAKASLLNAILGPLKKKCLYKRFGLSTARGILLSGPPGNGKTMLARAIAHEAGVNFIPVRSTSLFSQYFGEVERAISELFARARDAAPSILFFDEIDALAPQRGGGDSGIVDRMVAQLLNEMDGILDNHQLVVLAATNRPAAIDPALVRPGRFDSVIEIPYPDHGDRLQILRLHLSDRPCDSDLPLEEIAGQTEGFSGADLANVVERAAYLAVSRVIDKKSPDFITISDMKSAIADIQNVFQTLNRDYLNHGVPE